MDNDRATVDKGSLPVSMVHKKKQPGIAVYYQAKKAKVGRPKQVEKIVYSMEQYFFKQIKEDLDEDELGDLNNIKWGAIRNGAGTNQASCPPPLLQVKVDIIFLTYVYFVC